MMQKIAGLIALVLVLLAFTAVMPAAAEEVTTVLTIDKFCGAGGPLVKAKWERNTPTCHIFDDDFCTPGPQFSPTCIPEQEKTIKISAIVTDPDGYEDIKWVKAYIYDANQDSVATSDIDSVDLESLGPPLYSIELYRQDGCCYGKWQALIESIKVMIYDFYDGDGPTDFVTYDRSVCPIEVLAELLGVPCICEDDMVRTSGEGVSVETLYNELTALDPATFSSESAFEEAILGKLEAFDADNGGIAEIAVTVDHGTCACGFFGPPCAWLYSQTWEIPCDLKAGMYKVVIVAKDGCDDKDRLCNEMDYLSQCCVVYDFSLINYGTLDPYTGIASVEGDNYYNLGDGKPSVWNIGNDFCDVFIEQDAMGMDPGNIRYRARIDFPEWLNLPFYEPDVEQKLTLDPDLNHKPVPPCFEDNMDFLVKILNCEGAGDFTGIATLRSELYTNDG